jgi:hypothetical protein
MIASLLAQVKRVDEAFRSLTITLRWIVVHINQ